MCSQCGYIVHLVRLCTSSNISPSYDPPMNQHEGLSNQVSHKHLSESTSTTTSNIWHTTSYPHRKKSQNTNSTTSPFHLSPHIQKLPIPSNPPPASKKTTYASISPTSQNFPNIYSYNNDRLSPIPDRNPKSIPNIQYLTLDMQHSTTPK